MARVSASDQLTRLLALPAWVAEHPGVTVAEAAKHFGVTPAVIERDVNTLWVSGLPGGMHGDLVDFDAADFEAGRLRLSEPLGLDRPVRLTRQEAISLLMALRVLADLLADDDASAPVIASTQQAVTALLNRRLRRVRRSGYRHLHWPRPCTRRTFQLYVPDPGHRALRPAEQTAPPPGLCLRHRHPLGARRRSHHTGK